MVIHGLGGIGKTALILKYAEEYQSSYRWIHFIPSSTPEAMIIGLLKLADELDIARLEKVDERLQMLKVQLEKIENEYLLIFDGVDSPETFLEIQKRLPNRGKCILVTSRLEEDLGRLGFNKIKLDRFTEQEAVNFLFNASKTDDKEGAKRLAEKLGYLPLALTHAASYIRVQGCSIEKYLKQFEKYGVTLFEDKYLRLTKEEKTVLTTWQITMDVIERQEESPFAKPLLDFISFLASSNIPYEALKLWSMQGSIDELDFERAIGLLKNYSILDKFNEGYVVHPVVQTVIRHKLIDEKKQECLAQGLKIFNVLGARNDLEQLKNRDLTNAIVVNSETLIGYCELYRCKQGEDFLGILNYLTQCHRHFGKVVQANTHAEKASSLAKEMYPDLQHCLVALSLDNVGLSFRDLGKHEEALKYLNQSLALMKKIFGPEDRHVLTCLEHVGVALEDLGKHEDALKYHMEVLTLRKKTLGEDHPDMAVSLNNVGLSLKALGKHEDALKYQMEALALIKKVFGPEHYQVAASLSNVGLSFGELGKYKQALKYKMESLALMKKLFGPEHPLVAISLNNMGVALEDLGKHEEALKYKMEALALRKKLFGPEHPQVANSLYSAGLTLRELGKYEEALKYTMEALALRKKLLGEDHPEVAASLDNVGLSLGRLGKHEEALKYTMEALVLRKKLLGENHPEVAASLNNVGGTLGDLGKHGEALKYKMEALALMKKLFGPEHPHIAASLYNVGLSLRKLGKHEEALKYLNESLAISKKFL
ncbi:MAG: tetratricopeptide repeat protein [Rhabdochlamydiaceae bacterium]|nr:tetratricopeptide repeat protein [Rhabdochlamydiaceae bacterium]